MLWSKGILENMLLGIYYYLHISEQYEQKISQKFINKN